MNPHEQCLGRAQDYFAGRLAPPARAHWEAHRDACPDCAELLARWPHAAAVPDLAPEVLVALGAAPGRGLGARWLAPATAALALALLASAFWHPERQWVRDDQAWSDTCAVAPTGGQPCCVD